MTDLTRIKLDRDYVKSIIPKTKTIKEMSLLCNCSSDKLRHFMRENELYKYYCEQHKIKYNSTMDNLVCQVCGSNIGVRRFKNISYCKRHYMQILRYGRILESTIYDKNIIIIDKDIAKIIIKNKNQEIKDECIIDAEDVEKINNFKWYTAFGYCVTKSIDHTTGTDIANVIFDDYIHAYDHINHIRLDNRKINLRPITQHQNAMNMGKNVQILLELPVFNPERRFMV